MEATTFFKQPLTQLPKPNAVYSPGGTAFWAAGRGNGSDNQHVSRFPQCLKAPSWGPLLLVVSAWELVPAECVGCDSHAGLCELLRVRISADRSLVTNTPDAHVHVHTTPQEAPKERTPSAGRPRLRLLELVIRPFQTSFHAQHKTHRRGLTFRLPPSSGAS